LANNQATLFHRISDSSSRLPARDRRPAKQALLILSWRRCRRRGRRRRWYRRVLLRLWNFVHLAWSIARRAGPRWISTPSSRGFSPIFVGVQIAVRMLSLSLNLRRIRLSRSLSWRRRWGSNTDCWWLKTCCLLWAVWEKP